MARTPNLQISDPYCDVELQRLSTRHGEIPKFEVLVKDDTGEWQGVQTVSDGYQLIKNELVSNVVEDVKTRSGYEWHELKNPYFDGKRFIQYFMTDQNIMTINGDGSDFVRTLKIGLMAQNSYDGSSSFRLLMFLCAMECTNQFHSYNRFGSFIMRHYVGAEQQNLFNAEEAAEQVSIQAQKLIEFAPYMRELQKRPLELKDFALAKAGTTLPKSKWGDVLDRIEVDSPWGLFNALTDVASNDMSGLQSLSVSETIGNLYLNTPHYMNV